MPADSRLVIASNRLPFTVQRDVDALQLQPTSGGLASALASVQRQGDNVWVGSGGLLRARPPAAYGSVGAAPSRTRGTRRFEQR